MDNLVTIELLSKAMQNTYPDIPKRYTQELAEQVLNFFGFQDRITDNVLTPEDRDVFRMLEDHDLIRPYSDDIILYDGREWRIQYWILEEENISEAARQKPTEEDVIEKLEDTLPYESLPDDVWEEHARKRTI